jgi:hypothetical protein
MARRQQDRHFENGRIRENVRHAAKGPGRAGVAILVGRACVTRPPSREGEAEGSSLWFGTRLSTV